MTAPVHAPFEHRTIFAFKIDAIIIVNRTSETAE